MIGEGTLRSFDLGKVGEAGVRAIVEGLRIDGEHVSALQHDPATGVLEVVMTGADAVEHVESFVTAMARTHRLIARKVVAEHRSASLVEYDLDAALGASPDVLTLGDGLIGLGGTVLALFRFFEHEFTALARHHEAEERHYPVMVPATVLAEVGYFDHFPQHVTFCSHLPDSLPALEALVGPVAGDAGGGVERFAERASPARHVLTPGVCLPCYREYRDVVLQPGEVRTLTMQNHVFRYEGRNFRPLSRAWDFTVRDIVFFGGYADLLGLRSDVMGQAMELCAELDLEVTLELANDPFFLDASRDKAVYQRMGEVKYELLFRLPHRDETLAASSFNLHRDFYTAVYGTRIAGGESAESACMGFGLERWVYGFLSQKGMDPAQWPERVAASMG